MKRNNSAKTASPGDGHNGRVNHVDHEVGEGELLAGDHPESDHLKERPGHVKKGVAHAIDGLADDARLHHRRSVPTHHGGQGRGLHRTWLVRLWYGLEKHCKSIIYKYFLVCSGMVLMVEELVLMVRMVLL